MNGEAKTNRRLLSLDALRGFDMFFITGGATLVLGVCGALGCGDGWLAAQMRHVEWAGLAQHDTIFPLFLFLAGVSWPFSLGAQLERGRPAARIQLRILVRTAILFLLGFSFGGVLQFKPDFRLMGVLQFIGLSWGIAATLGLHIRRARVLAVVAAVLLVGYYCLLHFTSAPGAADSYSVSGCVVPWLDRTLFPNHILEKGALGYEPESLFSLPSGVALALFGVLAGMFLRRAEGAHAARTSAVLALAGVVGVGAACVTVFVLGDPVVKKLWTVSFILAAAAYSLLLLAAFYFIVDVLGWRRWTVLFDPVGKNSILAYMLMMTGVSSVLQRYLFAGLCEWAGAWRLALVGFTSYLVVWGILFFLRRKGVFLKV